MPRVTIIRPIKGVEPMAYECLASTFYQTYPRDKLTVYFCLSGDDPALEIARQVLHDFPAFDARIFVEEEDPQLQPPGAGCMGPNPKIRNASRAYREAKSDIVWILDCNVWVARGTAGRMVDRLAGLRRRGKGKKQKFVHQLPLVVDTTGARSAAPIVDEANGFQGAQSSSTLLNGATAGHRRDYSLMGQMRDDGGARLEELFLSSSHAKFYTAINTVLLAPCIIGKSNMFRRSHLNYLTEQEPEDRPPGLDYFSHNICEDHLVGDLLWKRDVPEETGPDAEPLGNHGLVFGDLAIQPMAEMSVAEYWARRVRWLRVRKFTVTAATLVEPGTESFLCSLYGAFAVTTLPMFWRDFGVPATWTTFAVIWVLSIAVWATVDWTLYLMLHSMASVEVDENTPLFSRPKHGGEKRRFSQWLAAWLGREALALPIWIWAVFGGVTVTWRGQKFRVGTDMKVHLLSGRSAHHLTDCPRCNVAAKAR